METKLYVENFINIFAKSMVTVFTTCLKGVICQLTKEDHNRISNFRSFKSPFELSDVSIQLVTTRFKNKNIFWQKESD